MASPQQVSAIANTYAKRQALVQVLGLTMTEPDTDAAPVEKITATQTADIEALAHEVGANLSAFCRHLGVQSLADIPADQFSRACKELERKRQR